MTKKRCTDCKHTKGIGYDFWCGEGHTEYEVFMGETNCPYYEYHDWSKGTPSRAKKRFTYENHKVKDNKTGEVHSSNMASVNVLNELNDENEQLKDKYNEQSVQYEGLEEQVERLLDFKDNVFNLINAKIKHYEHKPFSEPVGQPMSVNFDADVDRIARLSELQDLKRELQE